jgi:ElaB/YqjD/DUF883 family membrane-anchored ribosome-binding protein
MTQTSTQTSPQTSTQDVAKNEAAGVASSAGDAGRQVGGVAREQAGNVAGEAGRQAQDLVGQARDEVTRQAGEQQQRLAAGLRSLGTELGSMADRPQDEGQAGVATDLARQASARAHDFADYLEQRDPGSLVDEVKSFARRRPGTFLAIAAGAGLLAGRLTRGLKDEASSGSSNGATTPSGPTTPATPTGLTGPATPYGTPVPADSQPAIVTPAGPATRPVAPEPPIGELPPVGEGPAVTGFGDVR